MTKTPTTEERLRMIVAEQLGIDDADVTEQTFSEQGADSLDHVELIMQVEEEFELEIPDEDAEKLTTLPLLLQYVQRKTGKSHAARG